MADNGMLTKLEGKNNQLTIEMTVTRYVWYIEREKRNGKGMGMKLSVF